MKENSCSQGMDRGWAVGWASGPLVVIHFLTKEVFGSGQPATNSDLGKNPRSQESRLRDVVVCCLLEIASAFGCPYLIRSNFIKTTYDISLDSWISFLPLGFSPTLTSGLWMFFVRWRSSVGVVNPKEKKEMNTSPKRS